MTSPPPTSDYSAVQDGEPMMLDPSDYPNVDHLVTEDDTPVDNVFAAKQQRLLVETLYTSPALAGRTFIADANVGVFASIHKSAIVPDMFLSLDVELPPNFREKRYRSYFLWEYGKPPDVVVELISDRRGDELGSKMREYAQIGTRYYAIFDPDRHFKGELLRIYGLSMGHYQELDSHWLPDIGLGLTLWEGEYEGAHDTWLRWRDQDGQALPTGSEYSEAERQRAEAERQRAEAERQRAEAERQRAEAERQRADRLLAQLRALGIEPTEDPTT
jgi:Uma2 family endonuclease